MKQKIIGTYRLGWVEVQLVLREGGGADLFFQPGDIHYARMKIGADQDSWGRIVGSVMHEAGEYVMSQICCRYYHNDDFTRGNDGFMFILTHPQFDDVCCRAGLFLAECESDLCKAWKAWKKARR